VLIFHALLTRSKEEDAPLVRRHIMSSCLLSLKITQSYGRVLKMHDWKMLENIR